MPQRRHVHADLVGTARVNFYLQAGKFTEWGFEFLDNAVMRDGIATAVTAGGHARPLDAVAADGSIDGSRVGLRPALHQRAVGLFDFAPGKLFGEIAVRSVILCDQDQAAGLFVEAVYDAGTQL